MMSGLADLREISLHDSGLDELHFDALSCSLRLRFERASVYAQGDTTQCGTCDVEIVASGVEFLTIFQLDQPDFVVYGVFRQNAEALGVLDILRRPGTPVHDAEIRISPFAGITFRAAGGVWFSC